MRNLICLSGKQYSGKDTVAKVLLEFLQGFTRLAIGDAIKIEFGRQNGLSYDEIDKNKGIYRTGLIELGNKGRSIDPDFWLKKILEMQENLIVPDVRLVHEAEIFKSAGAFLIRVEADFSVREKRGKITNANDLTETELDTYKDFDYIINNSGSYSDLEAACMPLIKKIKEKFNLC